MKTIRWGIIGCGNVTEVKSGPGFQKARHSSLVAVMRRNGELAQDYAQRHGVPTWYDDAAALIHDPASGCGLRGYAALLAQGIHDHGGAGGQTGVCGKTDGPELCANVWR